MNPTKQQWQKVINNFERVLPMAKSENQLDMEEPRVNKENYKCGTIHCVGGWYAVATLNMHEHVYGFSDGAKKMAEDLGFNCIYELENWAAYNTNIWGNDNGSNMFYDSDAYNDAENLAEVVEFLKGVRDRSPEEEVING